MSTEVYILETFPKSCRVKRELSTKWHNLININYDEVPNQKLIFCVNVP